MRIGVEATCWNHRRGYGRHLRSLLPALIETEPRDEYVVFLDGSGDDLYPLPAQARVVRLTTSRPTLAAAAADSGRSLADLWAMSRAISRARLDLLLFPTVYSYVPVTTSAAKVLMIHDVIAERFPKHVFPNRSERFRWRLKSALARAQADRLVTVSEYSRRGLIDHFGLRPEQVAVVGEAPDPVFRPIEPARLPSSVRGAGIEDHHRLVTYVGGFGPHKNLSRLFDAFARLTSEPRFDDVRLVLVGDYEHDSFSSEYQALRSDLRRQSHESKIVFAGFLPDEDLAQLLNRSAMLVLPSLMEGLGLPAIEAAACGIPAVVTRNSPLPELLGEGAIAVDPLRPAAIAEALTRWLDDSELRARAGRCALAAARGLSPLREAAELRNLLGQIPIADPVRYEQTA